MSTATIERAATITEAAPLTESEANSLIALAASTEKVARVKGGRSTRESRGWSLGGSVD
ncbi:hypothetical protein SEA_ONEIAGILLIAN_93 [Microbacterium phage OneinaGillian]|uniref:Uncharacterized protein n=1 Tax=Microbacterium phage OneinaGillian TaxID=2301604 RepID=A0A385UHD2_9CAUD|nr:hypothetical protein HOU23_gp093 [Microbacterium phage OneinaGillian]AYB70203.1 hypothetical protein SEA_ONEIAGILLIAN_93 [Microbacterium phage OneinaGillian]